LCASDNRVQSKGQSYSGVHSLLTVGNERGL
jgi:hypothetical protein